MYNVYCLQDSKTGVLNMPVVGVTDIQFMSDLQKSLSGQSKELFNKDAVVVCVAEFDVIEGFRLIKGVKNTTGFRVVGNLIDIVFGKDKGGDVDDKE